MILKYKAVTSFASIKSKNLLLYYTSFAHFVNACR